MFQALSSGRLDWLLANDLQALLPASCVVLCMIALLCRIVQRNRNRREKHLVRRKWHNVPLSPGTFNTNPKESSSLRTGRGENMQQRSCPPKLRKKLLSWLMISHLLLHCLFSCLLLCSLFNALIRPFKAAACCAADCYSLVHCWHASFSLRGWVYWILRIGCQDRQVCFVWISVCEGYSSHLHPLC